jgi:hypothetical protein
MLLRKGFLDIMLNYIDETGKKKVAVIYNHLQTDRYFLKTTILNGKCMNGCDPMPKPKVSVYRVFKVALWYKSSWSDDKDDSS